MRCTGTDTTGQCEQNQNSFDSNVFHCLWIGTLFYFIFLLFKIDCMSLSLTQVSFQLVGSLVLYVSWSHIIRTVHMLHE